MKKRTLRGWRCAVVAAAAVVVSLTFGAAVASATTYYVAPDGQGNNCTQAEPCPITVGANAIGEVVVLPGDYMVSDQIFSLNTADVHGVAGQPRPRIFSTHSGEPSWQIGSFGTPPTITLRHIELNTTGSTAVSAGGLGSTTLEDVIVRATGGGVGATACQPTGGTGSTVVFKDVLCQGTEAGVGVSCAGCNSTVSLHNVTAIGETNGLAFVAPTSASTSDYTVTATNVIARHTGATGADVRAAAGSNNSDVVIGLDHSNYATRDQSATCALVCTATVTDPTTANNQTTAPQFVDAAGGDFHQAPGSPTVEGGVNDAANGTADIDGQQRQIGTLTDIGADELGRPTTTAVTCSPGSLVTPTSTTCTVVVTDAGPSPTAPTGIVAFLASGGGSFSGSGACGLAATGLPGESSCAVTYTTAQGGTDQITATAPRDLLHEGGQGAFPLAVTSPPAPPAPPAVTPPPNAATAPITTTRCKKKKASSAKRKRCKKKPR